MPLPVPEKGEEKTAFVSRCMGNAQALKDFPDAAQRTAVCNGQFTRARKLSAILAKVFKQETKKEQGKNFPAGDFAYVPDSTSPSTWKLRLAENPGAAPTAAQVGRAVAALGKGFRGQKVQIPAKDLPGVKRKVAAAFRKANPGRELPPVLKG